jgi:hypothetical protein
MLMGSGAERFCRLLHDRDKLIDDVTSIYVSLGMFVIPLGPYHDRYINCVSHTAESNPPTCRNRPV